jgi:hypothetical protein
LHLNEKGNNQENKQQQKLVKMRGGKKEINLLLVGKLVQPL